MSVYDYERDGYDTDDPKHPDFLESYLDWADAQRKREKEDELVPDDPALD